MEEWTMALPRDEVITGVRTEIEAFEGLIRSLTPDEWQQPSRCAGWTVADVAAHVTGTLVAIATGQLDTLTDPGHTQVQVEERRGRSPQEVADELRQAATAGLQLASSFDDVVWAGPAPAGIPGTLG